jgi:hypothetical protein
MSHLPRRTIEELRTRYELEPGLSDIFVEGQLDVDLVRWFLYCTKSKAEVYPIETVDVPSDFPDGIDPSGGNRTRLIRLANAFNGAFASGRVTCIIDSDFDHISTSLGIPIQGFGLPHLLRTDFTCMEMYFFTETSISKLCFLVCRRRDIAIDSLLADVEDALRKLFAVRCASHIYGFNFKLVDADASCSKRGAFLRFDLEDFINRILNKNAAQSQGAEFRAKIGQVLSNLSSERRNAAHGHDFLNILRWTLKANGIIDSRQLGLFEGATVGCIDLRDILEHELWKTLARYYG